MEHSEIAGILSGQLQEYLDAYASVASPSAFSAKNSTTLSAEARRTFCRQLSSCRDTAEAATLIQSNEVEATFFAKNAEYALDFYSKNRNLATLSLVDNGGPFSLLAELLLRYLEEMGGG
ncbi:MAG: hypothetical protein ACLQSR_09375 [Limisphaerales bacterium]